MSEFKVNFALGYCFIGASNLDRVLVPGSSEHFVHKGSLLVPESP